jgi:hypothetical protein
MCVLLTNHSGDVVWLLEIVPSWGKQSRRDLAEKHGNIVDKDEEDETRNDTIGDVICKVSI